MSTCCQDDTMQNLKQIQRQMKVLDVRLQMLRDRLCAARLSKCCLPCLPRCTLPCLPRCTLPCLPRCGPPCLPRCGPPCLPRCGPPCLPRCCPPCLPRCGPPCLPRCSSPCCLHHIRHLCRRALCAKLDLERRLERSRRLCMMLSSCCCPLDLIDAKGFDPKDVCVCVKDGKVVVSAERKEEHNTCSGKTCCYRKYLKEFSVPQGCCDKEVTYSEKSDSLTEIVTTPKCCSYVCDC